MIAYLEGRVLERTEDSCVLHTAGGVGYEVHLPVHSLMRLPEQGQNAAWYICHIVREDAQELYGFDTWDERHTFTLLLSINRVGARTALAVLSIFRPDDLRRLVVEDDALGLTRVPGIGKKSAQQIFLELKYKIKGESGLSPLLGGEQNTVFKDTLTGLVNLGYAEEEVAAIVRKVLEKEGDLDVGSALRTCLKLLAKGK